MSQWAAVSIESPSAYPSLGLKAILVVMLTTVLLVPTWSRAQSPDSCRSGADSGECVVSSRYTFRRKRPPVELFRSIAGDRSQDDRRRRTPHHQVAVFRWRSQVGCTGCRGNRRLDRERRKRAVPGLAQLAQHQHQYLQCDRVRAGGDRWRNLRHGIDYSQRSRYRHRDTQCRGECRQCHPLRRIESGARAATAVHWPGRRKILLWQLDERIFPLRSLGFRLDTRLRHGPRIPELAHASADVRSGNRSQHNPRNWWGALSGRRLFGGSDRIWRGNLRGA